MSRNGLTEKSSPFYGPGNQDIYDIKGIFQSTVYNLTLFPLDKSRVTNCEIFMNFQTFEDWTSAYLALKVYQLFGSFFKVAWIYTTNLNLLLLNKSRELADNFFYRIITRPRIGHMHFQLEKSLRVIRFFFFRKFLCLLVSSVCNWTTSVF